MTYRLHFPYLIEGFNKDMLVEKADDRFNSDTREYLIKGLKSENSTYDMRVKETGTDLRPGRIDVLVYQEGVEATIPLDLLANIKRRLEEATQNKIQLNINGKQVN